MEPSSNPVEPAESETKKDPVDHFPWLPCSLTVEVPVPGFTIADLLKMSAGTVIASGCGAMSDVPLRVNGQLIAWTEFDVVEDRLAVRITELA